MRGNNIKGGLRWKVGIFRIGEGRELRGGLVRGEWEKGTYRKP